MSQGYRRSLVLILILFAPLATAGCGTIVRDCDLPVRPREQQMCRVATEVCSSSRTPNFSIDALTLSPSTVRAGKSMIRRILYTYCPRKPGQSVRGTLQASIYLAQQELVTNRRGFVLNPGQNVYDAKINVPRAAEPGLYMLITRFNGTAAANFERVQAFKVVR